MTAEMKNPSVVLFGKKDLRLFDMPVPVPKDNEVLIKMHTVGICGSDIHMYNDGSIGNLTFKGPFTLGHEASGVVVECGNKVTNLKEGDAICVENIVGCGKCKACTRGKYYICKDSICAGCPSWNGFLSRYAVHPADYCYKLPETMDIADGAFVEPLAVAVSACERADIKVNSKVLVIGAGAIGLAVAMVAKAMGGDVCITETLKSRLEQADKIGVAHTILCYTSDNTVMHKRIVDMFGQEPEISIDCTGVQNGLALACSVTEGAGVVAMVGMGHHNTVLPLDDVIIRGIDLRGVCKYNDSFQKAIYLMSTGSIDVNSVITHRFPLEKALDAFKLVIAYTGETIKVHIKF